jgi:hypothetical protein
MFKSLLCIVLSYFCSELTYEKVCIIEFVRVSFHLK